MIEVQGLCKYYGDFSAIDDISFSIAEGEVVGLLGLNGAGKTTILKVLSSSLYPTKGSVKIKEMDCNSFSKEVRKLIGFLPDRPPLYDEMSIENYLKFVGQLRGVSKRDIAQLVDEALESTNLTNERKTYLGELSHGFRQRAGIAGAIVHKPKVLILDEPINGLDPIQIVEMRDLILSLKGNFTVVLSSHILSEITMTCDKILVIDKGKLVAQGTFEQLQKNMKKSIIVELEWRNNLEAIKRQLENMEAVESIKFLQNDNSCQATITLNSDVRQKIASEVINSGGELLGLKNLDRGLEDLFMKLINTKENQ